VFAIQWNDRFLIRCITGLRIGRKQLIADCKMISSKVRHILASEGDADQVSSQGAGIPDDFFRDLEDSWKGRVKREHAEDVYRQVDDAAKDLAFAVNVDFSPIVSHLEGNDTKGHKAEICSSYEDQAVWLRGKNFKLLEGANNASVNTALKSMIPALDAKGKKVGDEWWTTSRVESALSNYRVAVDKARARVLELLKEIAGNLQPKIEVIIFTSTLSVIAKTLSMHVSEGRRRSWVVPVLSSTARQMLLADLVPYWNDPAQGNAQPNMVQMESMFLLTGTASTNLCMPTTSCIIRDILQLNGTFCLGVGPPLISQ
jgi:hypothetical protein